LSLSHNETIKAFTETIVLVGGQDVKGVQSLEIALQRITQESSVHFLGASPSNAPSGYLSVSKSTRFAYADAVLGDELRLEAINCISILMNNKYGIAAVLQTPGLVHQIAFCLSLTPQAQASKVGSESRVKSANLSLRMKVAEVLGPLCLLSDEGLRYVAT
jgi:hypothetical protein